MTTKLTNKQRDILRCLDEEFRGEQVTLCLLSDALSKGDWRERDWVGWDSGNVYGSLLRLATRRLVERQRLPDGSYWRITRRGKRAWREVTDDVPLVDERDALATLGRLRELFSG